MRRSNATAMTPESYRDRVVDLTTELMEYRSTEDRPEAIDACMDHLADVLATAGIEYTRHRVNGAPSLVASLDGSQTPEIMFHGHLDVVPGQEQLFSPRVDGNELYGRGAADMKGGLAAMVEVMTDLAQREPAPSVGLMIVSDEERGGNDGVRHLLKEGYTPEFCITGEPNNLSGRMDVIIKQKGILHLEVTATGKSAHAATPENGDNAIEKLMTAYPDIKAVFDAYDGDWGPTVNFGQITGGEVINQVPDTASMKLDIRYPDPELRDEILLELRELPTVEIKSIGEGNPVDTDPENPHVRGLMTHAKAAMESPVNFANKPHASDLRHFASEGIPGVAFGPEAYGSHEPYERLLLDSIEPYCQTLYAFGANGPYQ